MTAVKMEFEDDSFDRLQELTKIGFSAKKIRGSVYTVINQVARDSISPAAKEVVKHLAVKQSRAKEAIKVTKKAKRGSLSAIVTVQKNKRPPLKDFKLKAINKKKGNGIRYEIKKGNKRTFARGFVIDKFNGNAFVNVGGREIVKLHGPSVWGVFKKQNIEQPTKDQIRERLTYRIDKFIKDQIRKYNFKNQSAGK